MAETKRDQMVPPTPRQGRPGQRQQERLIRLARRRRRRQIWGAILTALLVIGVLALVFWAYPKLFPPPKTTTTKHLVAHTGPNCLTASSLPTVYNSAPAAGPLAPPSVAGTPATNTDGLQCIDLKVGSGTVAKAGSTVSVQYTGWLQSSGQKFDSSYDNGAQPFSVTPLGQAGVIPGWNEGLVGVQPGTIRRIILPAALAYGAAGSPPKIPANSTLIFDITVVSVS